MPISSCCWTFSWTGITVWIWPASCGKHQVNASIIYITAHPGFALDSFPTYPLEYLLKPVDEDRLSAALDWD